MARSDRDRGRPAAAPRPIREPRSRGTAGLPIAALVSAAGLVVVAIVTLNLVGGNLSFVPTTGGGGNGEPGTSSEPVVVRTPTPSNVVVVPTQEPGIEVPGTLVYVKAGNVWLQAEGEATQLTSAGRDSMPSFSEDGTSVYFVRTRDAKGRWSVNGQMRDYQLDVPTLMRVGVDGGKEERLYDGLVNPPGVQRWSGFLRGPVESPNGRWVAMTTDLPDPSRSDVTLKLLNLRNGSVKDLRLDQKPPLGHQDPAWRPDGKLLAYVRNDRDGAKGAPRIFTWNADTAKTRPLSGPGYLHPAWSPDGRYLAATRTDAFGTDVVLLDARTGAELLRVTDDGKSWAPTWSPAGDQVAYLHVSGQVIDLRLAQLAGNAPAWTVADTVDLTTSAGLDGLSRPDWIVPADQLPAVTPPASEPAASPSG
jgi:dipeptidyl aminopeptidase/acylaminoacyl peptidase